MLSGVVVGIFIIAVSINVVLLCPSNCSCSTFTGLNINCNNKGLTAIPRDFPNDSSTISMDRNFFTTIDEGAFQNMTSLTSVGSSFSAISTIETGAFRNLPKLTNIHMGRNQITIIQQGAFIDLPSLWYISLDYNQIATIQKGTFVDLPSLTSINLSVNQIKAIQDGTFQDLPALARLYLYTNQIATIQTGLFQGLSALQFLYLSGNFLTFVNNGSFENLTSLRKLQLYNNQITTIQHGSFKDLSALIELRLENNQITTIPQGTFEEMSALNYLDLRGNNLIFVKNDTFEHNINLKHLYLDFVCDCNVAFWSWLKSKSLDDEIVTCLDQHNNRLSSLNASDFDNCTYNFCYPEYCSNGGSCSQDSYGDLVCSCIGEWNGATCTNNSCHPDYCLNGGSCRPGSNGDLVCSCVDGWTGGNCTEISCHSDYCSNGGSCSKDSNGDLVCSCTDGWTGANCTDSSCHPSYCLNGGSCSQNRNGDLLCLCFGGWAGVKCTALNVLVHSTNLCGENVDNFNTTWRLTEPNTLVVLPCTGEYTGNASRYCSSDGKWVEPSYIHCISKSIQQLKEQTSKLLSGESDYNLTIILKDLENITNYNDELRSGDLLTSSAVLNDIAKYVTDYSDKLEVDQLEIFGSLCDNLLDERNHRQWKELNDEGSGGVTPLVNAVTEYNNAFNEVIDSNYSLVVAKKNVVMQVGKTSVDEITVPDRQKTSNSWIADSATEIKLKKNICSGWTGYSSTFYRNISSFFPEYLILNGAIKPFNGSYDVNSIVADFTIHGTPCSNYSLIIKFEHLLGKYTRPFCGYWNFSTPNTVNGAWSSYGSQVVDDTDSYTICEYNHTTNFAILMSPGKTPSSHHDPLSYISAIGCGVSIFFLVITILIHFVLWRYLGNDRTKTLMNLCVALILSYILFLAGITRTENKIVCTAIAVALHYMFLTDFALMLAEGIQIVRMVVIVFPTKSIVHKLIPACWIVPACIVAISAGVTKLKGYGNEQFCWLTLESYLIWAFIGPALLVILINFIIIIITVYKMLTSRGLAAKTLKVKSKIGLKSICVILPLFGVTWVLGAFSVNDDLVIFQYLFAIFNSLQGLFICLFHCFLNKQVRQAYQQYQRRRHANRMDSKHSSEFSNLDRPKSRLSIKDNIRAQEK